MVNPPEVDEGILRAYYGRLFPSLAMYQWLSYGSPSAFSRREISFTLTDDIYIRYQSFDTQQEFLKALIKKAPIKIDIGAVYSSKPKDKMTAFDIMNPESKEIVFDIDMTDYDHIRTCCQGADVCSKCWKFMAIASKILDAALREDFNYTNTLWVFSGRRGIHCWVSDMSARNLDDTSRSALAEYLQVTTDGSNARKLRLNNIHPSIERALSIIDKYFVDSIIVEQDVLGTDERLNNFLSLIDQGVRGSFADKMSKVKSSLERWSVFEDNFNELLQKNQLPRYLKNLREEIKLQYSYPRLDINVTKGLNHLLKAPFCVHPKTAKICIPFNVKTVDSFDPNDVPTIMQLMDEINAYDKKTLEQEKSMMEHSGDLAPANKPKVKDYKKTSLLRSMMLFREFLRSLGKTGDKRKMDEDDLPF